jgi:rfaE bifunctional protein kinase chain/domain
MKRVFVFGVFNVLHPGHIRLFRFAKECGDELTVVVQSDEVSNNKAIYVKEDLRLEVIQSNSYVDHSFLSSDTIEELVKKNKPDIVVKGREYENRKNHEYEIIKSYGGELLFDSGGIIFSSLELLKNEAKNEIENINLPYLYMDRHNIKSSDLIRDIKKFSELTVTIIGDLIMDEYITCDPIGMSQEDPTLVVTPIDHKLFIGGAGIVASHAAGLGANVNFISVVGPDSTGNKAEDKLREMGVNKHLIIDNHRPTTLKKRYRCQGKTLLRVSRMHQRDVSREIQNELIERLESVMHTTDLLVFSDFNYGVLTDFVINKIIDLANKNKVYVVADSQSSSQVGDVSRYEKINMLTPTEREARISIQDHNSGLIVLAEKLRVKTQANNILLKLGRDGVIVHAENNGGKDFLTDRVEAINKNPKDVSGAGDSMLITASMLLTVGGNIWSAALLGSVAAGLQVARIGNQPLKAKELIQLLQQ